MRRGNNARVDSVRRACGGSGAVVFARTRTSVITDVTCGCRARRRAAPPYGRSSTRRRRRRRPIYAGGVTSRAPRYRSRTHTCTHSVCIHTNTHQHNRRVTHTRAPATDTHNGVPPTAVDVVADGYSCVGTRDGAARRMAEEKTHTTRASRTFSSSPSACLPATSAYVPSVFCARSFVRFASTTHRPRPPPDDDVSRSFRDRRPSTPPVTTTQSVTIRVCVCVCN